MTAANHEEAVMASYDNLTAEQEAWFDDLMTMPTSQWPPELIAHVRSQPGPFCGDALADAVAGWVRTTSTETTTTTQGGN
jgi:hypothetical protein